MAPSKRAVDYKNAIQAHALLSTHDTIYSGQQYTFLANQLQRSDAHGPLQDAGHALGIARLLGARDGQNCMRFRYEDLEDLLKLPDPDEGKGHVLFLRGHLPASWIASIGAKYIVDPEFFRRHLDLPSIPILQSLFATPCLPSVHTEFLTLRINTIFCTESLSTNDNRSTFSRRKQQNDEQLEEYFGRLFVDLKPGDSLVRSYSIMEHKFSVMEQDISISIEKYGKGWIGLVWLDAGKDLNRSPIGPWVPPKQRARNANLTTIPLPVPLHARRVALAHPRIQGSTGPNSAARADRGSFPQSGEQLPIQFDAFLDKDIASVDALYALSPIFSFAASSEIQFLNLMQVMYDDGLSNNETHRNPSASIQLLKAYKELLDKHRSKQEETLRFLQCSARTHWPRSLSAQYQNVVTTTIAALEEDFRYLVKRTSVQSLRCQEAMAILMNIASVAESKKQIKLASQVTKLTVLATFFLPLSFCTSIFGMNFRELEDLHIWIWAVVTISVILGTFVIYIWDVPGFIWKCIGLFKSPKKQRFLNSV